MTSPMFTLGFSFGTVPARQLFCILRSAPHARKGFLTGDVLMEHKPAPASFQNDTRRGQRAGRLDRNRLFNAAVARLLQLGVFGFGLREDGKVGVSALMRRLAPHPIYRLNGRGSSRAMC